MKIPGKWMGISGYWVGGHTAHDHPRWIASKAGWAKVRKFTAERFLWVCQGCGKHAAIGDCHHRFGRAGGKRDDRTVLDDGTVNLLWMDRACHDKAKIIKKWADKAQAEVDAVCKVNKSEVEPNVYYTCDKLKWKRLV